MTLHLTVKPGQDEFWYLHAGDNRFRCAIGKNGVIKDKKEGDGKTPLGDWRFLYGYYRNDRIDPPNSKLSFSAITKKDGWCDDPDHASYNQAITLPFTASHECLWRDDHLYDLVLVINHNQDPILPGQGSAVFLHIARPDYAGTEGCVAMALADWQELLPSLDQNSFITIQNSF